MSEISELVGLTFDRVYSLHSDELVFEIDEGRKFKFYHEQDCCENVSINDIVGDLADLLGSPITRAEERLSENEGHPEGYEGEIEESYTWTFYEFATNKGSVTVRWLGSSNGYYSESVNFVEVK